MSVKLPNLTIVTRTWRLVTNNKKFSSFLLRHKYLMKKVTKDFQIQSSFRTKSISVLLASTLGGCGLITLRCFSFPVTAESKWRFVTILYKKILHYNVLT